MEKIEEPIIGIIVPCYNEEAVIRETAKVLLTVLNDLSVEGTISPLSFLGFVDDGSRDQTWHLIEEIKQHNGQIKAIKLAGNCGHQNALLAGLYTFNEYANALISIDADLQDDVAAIPKMVREYQVGYEIVYGVRNKRDRDTRFKKYSALLFYQIMLLLGANIIYNHADYRLTSQRVILALKEYGEENLFLRGIFPLMGFKTAKVKYDRLERIAGNSKYSLAKMLAFAWEGVTSLSVKPLRLVTIVGFVVFGVSIALSFYVIFSRFYLRVVPGWSSIVLPLYLLGGIQLLAIGVIGEYLGKIYQEVKRRPRYIIDKII
ncbi:MAG: glycosyltransferase family 2 protein [Patescibacteria group bacterium]